WEAYHPASGYMSPEDLFVIDGRVWCGDVTAHRWEETTGATGVFYGTDIHQGKTDVEFAPDKDAYWFHHRCHLGKATEDYLLMSRTGIEFVDLKNQNWTLHHWVRGACLYGIMPANGMIYAPQHPCACYIGGKLYGLNALVPRDDDSPVLKPSPESERLTKGDAHAGPFVAADRNNEWPTYRGNNARSGAAQEPVAKNLKQAWSVQLGGELTPPVIAGGKVLVSLKDRQALCALDETSGKLVYRFLPGGRIDSPPSVYGNRVYFGCTDGCVYCITLDDGKLVWKYQAAPTPIHHMYFENLEATHPVHGTVLVRDGKVYTVSGRSMFVDGGMRFLILDAQSGEKLAERVMDDKVPGSDQELQMHHEFLNMPMAMPDILSCNRDKIFMRFQEFDLEGNRMPLDFPRQLFGRVQSDVQTSTETVEDQKGEDAHIFSGTGFLDDSWWHRTYWIYGKNYMSGWPGYYLAGKSAPAGRILAHDADGVFGWGRMKEYFRWSKTYQYMLFATDYDYQPKWARAVPILVRGMLKAGDGLTIVGPEEMINQEEAFVSITLGDTQELLARQEKALQGAEALLLDVDPATGTIRSGYRLHTSPVFDGVASNDGRLFASLSDGSVVCYGPDGDKVMKPLDRQTIERFNGNAELRPPAAAKKGAAKGKNAKKAAKQKAN
ncbi:MAG: PQQ-binding-like beta-propeller repeat protein, partial [Planctomycetota bacterium]